MPHIETADYTRQFYMPDLMPRTMQTFGLYFNDGFDDTARILFISRSKRHGSLAMARQNLYPGSRTFLLQAPCTPLHGAKPLLPCDIHALDTAPARLYC